MVLGKELIVDVEDIKDYLVLEIIDGIKRLMEKVIEKFYSNVVGKCEDQFSPVCLTML